MSKLAFLNFHFYSQAQKTKQSEKPNLKGYSSWLGSFLTPLAGFLNNANTNQMKKGNILPNHSLVEDQTQNVAANVKLGIGWLHGERKESVLLLEVPAILCCWV